jgi:hypothetical protein
MRTLAWRALVTLGLLIALTFAAAPRTAYACSGEPPDPNDAALIAEGRVERVTLRPDLAPGAERGAFTPVEVTLNVEHFLKGDEQSPLAFVEPRSAVLRPDGSIIWAGASGACGILDADPTGRYALIVFGRGRAGELTVNRIAGAVFGDGPDDPRVQHFRQYLTSRLSPTGERATATPAPPARTLTITPGFGPVGTRFAIEGSNFPPGETLIAGCCSGQVARPPAPGVLRNPAGVNRVQVDEEGRFRTSFDSSGYRPGWYFMFAGRDFPDPENQPLAITQFFIAGPPTPGEPTFTLTPRSGPAGTPLVVSGTGFSAGERAEVRVVGANGQFLYGTTLRVQAGADGTFTASLDSSGFEPGLYQPLVQVGDRITVVDVPFTIAEGNLPGLPNTGGGGAPGRAPLTAGLLVGGALLALLGRVALRPARRRRRAG